ncbi:modular serine protease-like [Vanessa cardui]|uniref:modular serine protease-like n=1 Tax=Vanessa cardui TaxID=171605 RepID=UPI001F12E320|nr:modular serine protease-like [Vanessa cardui]
MLLCALFIVFTVSQPAFTYVVTEETNLCTLDELTCQDGACVPLNSVCDGKRDCFDGSDELNCGSSINSLTNQDITSGRSRRQTTSCRKYQWQCRDGTCIGFDGKCDGIVDCPDGSDETHALCRNTKCQSNWFRCTYGACVDGTAPCNGIKECADESDELLPRCRNETDEIRGQFRCVNGQTIPASEHCDGIVDCSDGSDETVRACAAKTCASYLFQCAYGACVDQGSDCNGKKECADNSDESDELCNRISPGSPTPATVKPTPVTTKPTDKPLPQGGKCKLPPFPEHGTYTMGGNPNVIPGQTFPSAFINITCNPGYGVERNVTSVYCFDGDWSDEIPKCLRFCRLNKHESVEYRCRLTGPGSVEGTRECGTVELAGTVVKPICRSPNYYTSDILNPMRCIDGSWTYIAICKPECGTITPGGTQLVIGGKVAKRGELPWHTGIYRKEKTPYEQICGGSLISTTTIISAAHCFWNDTHKLLPASNYAVAVGKIYRDWDDPHDFDAQQSDVANIVVPPHFRGAEANFQDDIALVVVATPFTYQVYIRPVCIDFDVNFDRTQLTDRTLGKVAGWGLAAENGNASQVLKVVELPYVKIEECFAVSPPSFREYITSDKICAGYTNGTALCQGDSGGGLAFPASERSTQRFYLRGVVSTAPRNAALCNAHTLTAFTQIIKHEHFIKDQI